MPFTTWTGSPLLPVQPQPQEATVADYDTHEGYDPRRRDEEDAKPEKKQPAKAEEPKPEPKKPDH